MPDLRPLRGLRGKRVYLRPLEPEDAELVASWYADERVRWLMGDHSDERGAATTTV